MGGQGGKDREVSIRSRPTRKGWKGYGIVSRGVLRQKEAGRFVNTVKTLKEGGGLEVGKRGRLGHWFQRGRRIRKKTIFSRPIVRGRRESAFGLPPGSGKRAFGGGPVR